MMDDRVRPWLFALLRGLLCVVLTLEFGLSALDSLGPRLEHSSHDHVEVAESGKASFRGSGNPRIVKRAVGDDHLAINAAVPDAIVAHAPCLALRIVEAKPNVLRSDDDRGSASVRGPPVDFTI
jgi:hypothetical protein